MTAALLTPTRSASAATRPSTRALLACGVAAGPVFVATVVVQTLTRTGFEPRQHPLSLLSLGDLGWIQIGNFLIAGLLTIASAVGLRRALRPGRGGTWGPILFAANGAALIAGGVFLADPAGYPVGAAETITWHGTVHNLAPVVSSLAGLAGYGVFARRFAGLRQRGWVAYCIITPVVVVALNVAALALADFRLMLAGAAVGWLWTSLVLGEVMRSVASASRR